MGEADVTEGKALAGTAEEPRTQPQSPAVQKPRSAASLSDATLEPEPRKQASPSSLDALRNRAAGFFRRLNGRKEAAPVREGGRPVPSFASSLSGRLLMLTIAFVMLSEVLVYIPSIANARNTFLQERVEAAQIAVLAIEASESGMVAQELTTELLENVGVHSIALRSADISQGYLAVMPPMPDMVIDLRALSAFQAIRQALGSMLAPPGRTLLVIADAPSREGARLELVMPEQPLRAHLFTFSRNILLLSIFISVFTATLVYFSLSTFLVRPMQRFTANMVAFSANPEDARRIIQPSPRRDEIGVAQHELARMQTELLQNLQQKNRLAALGTAVSKINHDLRNILASSQLISDRLQESDDPLVKRLSPKLVNSIDRAVSLCTDTLKYGRVQERPPEPRPVPLPDILHDVAATAGLMQERPGCPACDREGAATTDELHGPEAVSLIIDPSCEVEIWADPEHLFRALLNLARNAAQALQTLPAEAPRQIKISCAFERGEQRLFICDTGPGIPEAIREKLFQPFGGSTRKGGTGLGLSIAKELVVAHGGNLTLSRSDGTGTEFLLTLPSQA